METGQSPQFSVKINFPKVETDQSHPPGIIVLSKSRQMASDKYYLGSSNESPQVPEFGDLESPSALESNLGTPTFPYSSMTIQFHDHTVNHTVPYS